MRLPENLHLIKTPVPYPLKYVNCYLLETDGGWVLIDAGCHDEATEQFWKQTLQSYGVAKGQLTDIYVTHFHPDHLGAAGWLQQEYGANVVMHAPDKAHAILQWNHMEEQADRMAELFTRNGTPEDIVKQVREFFVLQSRDTLPLPERISDMHAGDKILLGGASYEVVSVPGHADGMVGFWDAASRVFIAADSILPHITPNVGIWPKCSDNPLADYFATLRKIAGLAPALTLPGHGEPMENAVERAEAIIAHHHDRLNAFEKSVEQGLTTAYAIANEHFRLGRLSPHQIRFAIAEAHAHLEYLVSVGRLSKTGDEVHHYAKKVGEG